MLIHTKFMKPTKTLHGRIKATYNGKSMTVTCIQPTEIQNHEYALRKMIHKMDLPKGDWMQSILKQGERVFLCHSECDSTHVY